MNRIFLGAAALCALLIVSGAFAATTPVLPRLAPPTFTPVSGTYPVPIDVSISHPVAGVALYYTTDGKVPTTASARYTSPIPVATRGVIRVMAVANGFSPSYAATGIFTIKPGQVSIPRMNPPQGIYRTIDPVRVTLTAYPTSAQIFYTTNGTAPTTSSARYTGPITLTQTTTIRAQGFAPGMRPSVIASGRYTILAQQVATPRVSPAGGTFNGPTRVTISTATPSSSIWYTFSLATPVPGASGSFEYRAPLMISTTTPMKVAAFKPGYLDSKLASANFVIRPAGMTISKTALDVAPGATAQTYSIVLTGAPETGKTVTIQVGGGTNLTVTPRQVDFTSVNWRYPRVVQVVAPPATAAGLATLTHTASSADARFQGMAGASVAVTVRGDTAGTIPSILGLLTEDDGRPVSGATVTAGSVSAVSNSGGGYTLRFVPASVIVRDDQYRLTLPVEIRRQNQTGIFRTSPILSPRSDGGYNAAAVIVPAATTNPPPPPPTTSLKLELDKNLYATPERPLYTVSGGTANSPIRWSSWTIGKNGTFESTGENNNDYCIGSTDPNCPKTDAQGYWQGYGGAWQNSQIGLWRKQALVNGTTSLKEFTVTRPLTNFTRVAGTYVWESNNLDIAVNKAVYIGGRNVHMNLSVDCNSGVPVADGLVNRANDPDAEKAFSNPYITAYVLTTFGANACFNGKFYLTKDKYDNPAKITDVENEYSNFTYYLYQKYKNTGKKFIISHWEGDNAVYCESAFYYATDAGVRANCDNNYWQKYGYSSNTATASDSIDGLKIWLQARQRGVEDGRRRAAAAGFTGVEVAHAVEINIVRALKERNIRSVLYDVVPEVGAHYISYSSYESVNEPDYETQLPIDLDTISVVGRTNNVLVGEFGFPRNSAFGDENAIIQRHDKVLAAAINWGVKYIFTWVMTGNEFGLINNSGVLTPLGAWYRTQYQTR